MSLASEYCSMETRDIYLVVCMYVCMYSFFYGTVTHTSTNNLDRATKSTFHMGRSSPG